MKKVFSFGELLLRISPELNRQWIRNGEAAVYLGGAELNVANALAKWNIPTKYCTALPGNYLTTEIIEELKEKNIDTSSILMSGNKLGTYYLPQGADLKNAGVIYDRANSSFAELKPGIINWDEALNDCNWFHFSAISPALNENTFLVCKEALQAASAKSLTISVDLNFRAKLWQYSKRPVEVMSELLPYCNVVMGNIWAAEKLLEIVSPIKESSGKSKEELADAAIESMKQLQVIFPNVITIAYSFRLEDTYFGMLQQGNQKTISKNFFLENIVDKVGSGDCFMAGLIYGICNQDKLQDIIDFASSSAVGKMQERGDATNQTIQSIKNNIARECTTAKS